MITTDQYANYFSVGMKVGVGIPMHNAETFSDWAIIHGIDEDLVFLQLSRDQLPVDVSLHIGQILELRGGKEGSGYSCRAIIVSEGTDQEILLRLIGEIVTDELREFYRIDAFLPIKYCIATETHLNVLEKDCIERREQRLADELMLKQQPWGGNLTGEVPLKTTASDAAESEDDELSWDTVIPLAANISGGGIRFLAHQYINEGGYVTLEILVPTPHYIVDAVAKVVAVKKNLSVISDRESYNISLKFVVINERDRDAIVNYIANIQLKRIRQLRMQYALIGDVETPADKKYDRYAKVRQIVYLLILLGFIAWITEYMVEYTENKPKSEIEEIFEGGLRKYLLKMGK